MSRRKPNRVAAEQKTSGGVASWARRHWRYLAVFVIAFALRAAFAATVDELPISRTPRLDSAQYLSWSQQIARGDHQWPTPPPSGPGYPYFLASTLTLGHGSLEMARLLQALIGALACVVTLALTSRWFGATAGLIAGLLQAVYGPLVYTETALLPEGLLIFFLYLGWFALLSAPTRLRTAVIAGLCLGIACIVRSTALVFVPIALVIAIVDAPNLVAGLRRAAVVAALIAAVVLPVMARNARTLGAWQIQGYGGLNFYIGNRPQGDGTAQFRLGNGWDWMNSEAVRHGIESPALQDRYYLSKGVTEIKQAPAKWVRLLGEKFIWTFQADEIRDSHSYYFFVDQRLLLVWLIGFGLVFPLALVGVVTAIRERRLPWALVAIIAGSMFTTTMLVVGSRYRLPLVPACCALAGLGAVELYRAWATRRWPAMAVLGVIAIAGVVATNMWRHDASHNLAEEWAYTGASLISERDLPDAKVALLRAVSLDPASGFGWESLGNALTNEGDYAQARRAYDNALKADARNVRAHMHLAMVLDTVGDAAGATTHWQAVNEITPRDYSAQKQTASHLLRAGDRAGAIAKLEWLTTRIPGDAEVRAMLDAARR